MRLSGTQVIGVVAALLVAGALKWQYSWRYKDERDQLEAIERENAASNAARMKQLDQMKQHARALRTGIPSCDAIADLMQDGPPTCKNAKARGAIDKLLAGSLDRMTAAKSAAEMGTICQQILDEIAVERARCGA
jgi:hypothetical protein